MEAALQAAFMAGGDGEWDRLLELTGAAAQEDARAGAPCVNLQHADTGRGPSPGRAKLVYSQCVRTPLRLLSRQLSIRILAEHGKCCDEYIAHTSGQLPASWAQCCHGLARRIAAPRSFS